MAVPGPVCVTRSFCSFLSISTPPKLQRALVTVATKLSLRSPGRCFDLDQIEGKVAVGGGWKVVLARASGARAVSTRADPYEAVMRGLDPRIHRLGKGVVAKTISCSEVDGPPNPGLPSSDSRVHKSDKSDLWGSSPRVTVVG